MLSTELKEKADVIKNITERFKQEKQALSTLTSETLLALNVSIQDLPSSCQKLLHQVSIYTQDIGQLDPSALSLLSSRKMSQELSDDYEILKLEQKNLELQRRIDRNKTELQALRADLEISKTSLWAMKPNPSSIHDVKRQMGQKMMSYKESCAKAEAKFKKLSVPKELYPESLDILVKQLEELKLKELQLKERAEDAEFSRQMRNKLARMRK